MKQVVIILIYIIAFPFMVDAQTLYSDLANEYALEGNYIKAIELEQDGLRILQSIRENTTSPEYAAGLSNIIRWHSDMGNFYETNILANQLQDILNICPENEYYTIMSMDNLSMFLFRIGDYSGALVYENKVRDYIVKNFGTQSYEYADCLNKIAAYNSRAENINTAFSQVQESLDIISHLYGENNIMYALSLNTLCDLYTIIGNFQEAINIGSKVLQISEYNFGKESFYYLNALSNLGNYHGTMGNYKDAINFIEESIAIAKRLYGDENIQVSNKLHNLAILYSKIGDNRTALDIEEKAFKIAQLHLSRNSKEYAAYLDNLSIYNNRLGNSEEAIAYGKESLDIRQVVCGEESIEYSKSLDHLVSYFLRIRDFINAYNYAYKAVVIREKLLGQEHPLYATSLMNLADVYACSGDFEKALKNTWQAYKIRENIFGQNHPDVILSTNQIAFYSYLKKDYEKMYEMISLGISSLMYNTKNAFTYLSSAERNAYWNSNRLEFEKYLPRYVCAYPIDKVLEIAYNGILFSKGIILNANIELSSLLGTSGSADLLNTYNEIRRIKMELNQLYNKPKIERIIDTDSLELYVKNLERQLVNQSLEYGNYTHNFNITWKNVQQHLGDNDVSIEFVSYPSQDNIIKYIAYILRKEDNCPKLVELCDENEINWIIDADNPQKIYMYRDMSNLIWGKLRPYLEGIENVYFAPEGILHQIAIEYLPDFENEGRIFDRFNCYRLSSTREIVTNKPSALNNRAIIYGGIRYDTDMETMKTESKKYNHKSTRGSSNKFELEDSSLIARSGLDYLPFTLNEVVNIKEILNINNYPSIIRTGHDASEESVKNMSGKNTSIIHISTHGFYWSMDEADRRAKFNDNLTFMSKVSEDDMKMNTEDKALSRSGLFMAGAKNILSGKRLPEGVEDGILTAQEISYLDLRGLDLIVLSACQTGMGDISGDGVFGLQRGFKKAGANSILMSLWDVDDEATQILMTEFYMNYLGGMSKRESLLAAQKKSQRDPWF